MEAVMVDVEKAVMVEVAVMVVDASGGFLVEVRVMVEVEVCGEIRIGLECLSYARTANLPQWMCLSVR